MIRSGRRKISGCRNGSKWEMTFIARLGITLASLAFALVLPTAPLYIRPMRASQQVGSVSVDVAAIRSRLLVRYATDRSDQAGSFLISQRPDGSWSDIDYNSTNRLTWSPLHHMDRLQQMSIAFGNPTSPLFKSASVLSGISHGLSYWFAKEPSSTNWWFNQIGQQLALGTC